MSDQTAEPGSTNQGDGFSRRSLLRMAGVGAAAVGGGGLLEACSSGVKGSSASTTTSASASSGGSITIGWIHPLTGPLAGFGAADNFVISKVMETTPYKSGFKIGGTTYSVNIKSSAR